MTIRASIDGSPRTFADAAEFMAYCEQLSRRHYSERYAPDRTSLLGYRASCEHTKAERVRGSCRASWAHPLASWERAHGGEPTIPAEDRGALASRGVVGPPELAHPALPTAHGVRRDPPGLTAVVTS